MNYDFSGYATKNDLKCTDGRIIRKDAFKHNDGEKVPLVWQHLHNSPENVLGHAILENKEDGVLAHCMFNSTKKAQDAKELVIHEDITRLSIYANELIQKGSSVVHGSIKEVSLVLSGANPGAKIENINLAHGDGEYEISDEEAIITTGATITHAEGDSSDNETVEDVFNTLSDKQKDLVYAMLGSMAEEMEQSGLGDAEENLQHSEGGNSMKKNVFDGTAETGSDAKVLTHAQIKEIIADAVKMGSMEESVIKHAGTYGIDNIDILFPDAKLVGEIDFEKRRTEWVNKVLNGVHQSPFSRIKTAYADITAKEARARGYITANEKFEEVFPLFTRKTEPTTIYKKQKLDRDDIVDIVDLDIVSWLKTEMRLMLDEERARAYLIGDGREVTDPDKVDETRIRPIYKDVDLYAHKVKLLSTDDELAELEKVIAAMDDYKGSGNPTLFTTRARMTKWKLLKDNNGQYRFRTLTEIADFIGVKEIVDVEVMQGVSRVDDGTTYDLLGIIVNLRDYTSGADKGGRVAMFDDFDIDFNQEKYLIETRCSGALTKIHSAIIIEKAQAAG